MFSKLLYLYVSVSLVAVSSTHNGDANCADLPVPARVPAGAKPQPTAPEKPTGSEIKPGTSSSTAGSAPGVSPSSPTTTGSDKTPIKSTGPDGKPSTSSSTAGSAPDASPSSDTPDSDKATSTPDMSTAKTKLETLLKVTDSSVIEYLITKLGITNISSSKTVEDIKKLLASSNIDMTKVTTQFSGHPEETKLMITVERQNAINTMKSHLQNMDEETANTMIDKIGTAELSTVTSTEEIKQLIASHNVNDTPKTPNTTSTKEDSSTKTDDKISPEGPDSTSTKADNNKTKSDNGKSSEGSDSTSTKGDDKPKDDSGLPILPNLTTILSDEKSDAINNIKSILKIHDQTTIDAVINLVGSSSLSKATDSTKMTSLLKEHRVDIEALVKHFSSSNSSSTTSYSSSTTSSSATSSSSTSSSSSSLIIDVKTAMKTMKTSLHITDETAIHTIITTIQKSSSIQEVTTLLTRILVQFHITISVEKLIKTLDVKESSSTTSTSTSSTGDSIISPQEEVEKAETIIKHLNENLSSTEIKIIIQTLGSTNINCCKDIKTLLKEHNIDIKSLTHETKSKDETSETLEQPKTHKKPEQPTEGSKPSDISPQTPPEKPDATDNSTPAVPPTTPTTPATPEVPKQPATPNVPVAPKKPQVPVPPPSTPATPPLGSLPAPTVSPQVLKNFAPLIPSGGSPPPAPAQPVPTPAGGQPPVPVPVGPVPPPSDEPEIMPAGSDEPQIDAGSPGLGDMLPSGGNCPAGFRMIQGECIPLCYAP